MAETPTVERFLHLEDATGALLTELQSLQKETVSFGEAHATVAVAAGKLGTLAEGMAQLTRQMGESARALREIGTPELLAQQARLSAQLDGISATLSDHQTRLTSLDTRIAADSEGAVSGASHMRRLLYFVLAGIVIVAVMEVAAFFMSCPCVSQ